MPALDVRVSLVMIIKVANEHRYGNEVHLKISVCRSSVGFFMHISSSVQERAIQTG